MPVYIYEHTGKSDDCPVEFERHEKITSDGLKKCPICKHPVQRIIKDVNFSIDRLQPSELNRLGIKKLVRKDAGVYEVENKGATDDGPQKLLIDDRGKKNL